MEGIQFPLSCCFIPESVFLPLTSSPAQLLKRLWPKSVENRLFGIDIFLKIEKCLSRRQLCFRREKKSGHTSRTDAVFGTVGECGSATLSRGEMVDYRGVRGVLSLYLPPKSPHCGSLRSRCYSWGLCILAWYWTLQTDRQTVMCLLECSREYLSLTPPTSQREEWKGNNEHSYISLYIFYLMCSSLYSRL